MNGNYIQRSLEVTLKRAAEHFPSVTLTGPRQSGKTTLLKQLFGSTHRYVSMEMPQLRALVEADPEAFFRSYPPPLIIDEAQYAPIIFPYVKEIIDNRRSEKGLFILSGSQNFALLSRITESLAGRTAVLRLLPLSYRELVESEESLLPWERDDSPIADRITAPVPIWNSLWKGFYPELATLPDSEWQQWHGSYIQSYLERDVRSLRQVGDLAQFQAFLQILAARSAQLLNLSDVARDIGISANTAKHWLSVLEASYTIIILRPYFMNAGKRLVKMPKVYFTDTGTLCSLTGCRLPEQAASGPMAGAIFETAVITEIYKRYANRGEVPRMYFWRTSTGTEVDLVIDQGQQLIPIEIKTTSTPWPGMAASIRTLFKDFPDRASKGYIIYPGDLKTTVGHNVTALPFSAL